MKAPLVELVNKLLHHGGIEECVFTIEHRGSPGDEKELEGSVIVRMEDRFLITEDGTGIPLHRIKEIRKGDELIWRT